MDSIPILNLAQTPLADKFITDQARYPLNMVLDTETWLMRMDDSVYPSEQELFGADYGFSTASSPTLVSYFAEYASWLKYRFIDILNERSMVEIGCNDGTLLGHFRNYEATGIDPSRSARDARDEDAKMVRITGANRMDIMVEPFTSALAREMVNLDGSDRLVVANNVLAHVVDLDDTLEGIALLVGTRGAAVVEFGYAGDLIANADYPLVYHEHRRFFSFTSLSRVLRAHNLEAVSVRKSPQQGGSLRVTIRPKGHSIMDTTAVRMYNSERWLRRRDTYTALQGRVDYLRDRLAQVVLDEHTDGRRIGLLGASAKATTLLHATGIDAMIDVAEDLTPYKWGRRIPGTSIPIVSPDNIPEGSVDTWIVGVPNYLGSLIHQHPQRRFITTPDAKLLSGRNE